MVSNLFSPEQIIIACVLGILAGATYYALGAWLLLGWSRQPVEDEPGAEPYRAPPAAPRSKEADEAIAKFIEELRRPDRGSPRRIEPQ